MIEHRKHVDSPLPLQWAIVGYGAGGRSYHAPMIRSCQEISLSAVVASARHTKDPSLEGIEVRGSLEDVLDLGVEGVTVTTPPATHAELAHEALDLGLHVVVDKPFALTSSEARDLVAHAKRVGKALSVYQNRRWDGDLLTMKAIIDSNELGRPLRFYSRIQRFKPEYLPVWNTSYPVEKGGGTLLDLGPHLIDQAIFLFGRVLSVYAELDRHADEPGAENDVLLSLVHETGARSLIEASIVAATEGPRFQLNASEGGVTIDGYDIQDADLFAGRTPDILGSSWGKEPAERVATVTYSGITEERPLESGAWTAYYPALARAIRGLGPLPVDPMDAVHTAEVIDASRQANANRGVVDLAEWSTM